MSEGSSGVHIPRKGYARSLLAQCAVLTERHMRKTYSNKRFVATSEHFITCIVSSHVAAKTFLLFTSLPMLLPFVPATRIF